MAYKKVENGCYNFSIQHFLRIGAFKIEYIDRQVKRI